MKPGRLAQLVYACPHCNSTGTFLAYKEGTLVRVLEDHSDVEGLDKVGELLCTDCDRWFPNPTWGEDVHSRTFTGELVVITGLRGDHTIKVVASGIAFPFHYDTYDSDAVEALRLAPDDVVENLRAFASHHHNTLAIRVKEAGNDNTWVYRLKRRRVFGALDRP